MAMMIQRRFVSLYKQCMYRVAGFGHTHCVYCGFIEPWGLFCSSFGWVWMQPEIFGTDQSIKPWFSWIIEGLPLYASFHGNLQVFPLNNPEKSIRKSYFIQERKTALISSNHLFIAGWLSWQTSAKICQYESQSRTNCVSISVMKCQKSKGSFLFARGSDNC